LPLFPNPATYPVYLIPLHSIPLKITNFHTVKFSPFWRYLLLRSPKFLSQHPTAQDSQPIFFLKVWAIKFCFCISNRRNYFWDDPWRPGDYFPSKRRALHM
jgi:hypothetical protein